MTEANKATLQKANAAISTSDNEGCLSLRADDIVWTTVGGETIHGRQTLCEWMATGYAAPREFTVHTLIGDGDFVVALGDIMSEGERGAKIKNSTAMSGASATERWLNCRPMSSKRRSGTPSHGPAGNAMSSGVHYDAMLLQCTHGILCCSRSHTPFRSSGPKADSTIIATTR